MNNNLGFRIANYFEQQCFIEYIHNRWLNAEIAKYGGLLQRTRRADNKPTIIDEQPAESTSDSPTRTCYKYSVFHDSMISKFNSIIVSLTAIYLQMPHRRPVVGSSFVDFVLHARRCKDNEACRRNKSQCRQANFKDRIHESPDQWGKLPAYSRLWSHLLTYQRSKEAE